jgi:hypothetical protein
MCSVGTSSDPSTRRTHPEATVQHQPVTSTTSTPTTPTSAELGDAVLEIRPWADPVVDELGHDPRSHYVEHYWLGILGPSTTLLLRHLASGFDSAPDGFTINLADTARSLGLGVRSGRNTPFLRAIDRSCQFGMARRHREVMEVRRRLPPLTRLHLARLPDCLQLEHMAWQEEALRAPRADEQRRRARRLALGLYQLGEDTTTVELQLHEWQFHPAMAYDAVRWAQQHVADDAGGTAA